MPSGPAEFSANICGPLPAEYHQILAAISAKSETHKGPQEALIESDLQD